MTATALIRPSARRNGPIEPLENGERLSAPEFMRRYEAMPWLKKAELVEGIVFMGSPVRVNVHAQPDNLIQTWLGLYSIQTPGVKAGGNGTVQLDFDNVPQPDAFLRILAECGGASRLDAEGYLVGPPEMVVEIAASSTSIDLHEKMDAYRRNGVKEYLVWRTTKRAFDWFVLKEGAYERQLPDAKGVCRSAAFPGLALNVPALLAEDGVGVLATLTASLKSASHRAFLLELAAQRTGKNSPDSKTGRK